MNRTCTKCGVEKPATLEHFASVGKGRSSPDGLQARCLKCARAYHRRLRERDPDIDRRYYVKNKERLNAQTKAYYEENKEALLEWQRTYAAQRRRAEDRDHVLSLEAAIACATCNTSKGSKMPWEMEIPRLF